MIIVTDITSMTLEHARPPSEKYPSYANDYQKEYTIKTWFKVVVIRNL